MASFEIILLLLGCMLASSVFGQVLPRVSLPLAQIALGAVVGTLVTQNPTEVLGDPELFLVLFIAPLLFEESRHANKEALLRNWAPVSSLAVGLVVVTTLVVGFTLHAVMPSIPLAAALALGAALGPTDAAAVAAMGADVTLTERQKSLLSGEALFNDASGVVCFEFAIAVAVGGAFSLANATATFFIDFFGGVLVGLVLAVAVMFVLGRIRALGLETPTEFVLFEVCMPFATFLIAEGLGASGVLAVVSAGLLMRFYPSRLTPESSRHAVASENVWELLTFVINGSVFLLLGMKLPATLGPYWRATTGMGALRACGLVVLVTALVVGIRLVWVIVLEWLHRKRKVRRLAALGGEVASTVAAAPSSVLLGKDLVRSALVTTLSGPKGAVTLSIMLTIPFVKASGMAFPARSLLVFMASGVIVLALLLANFVVPLLAPAAQSDGDNESLARAKAKILRRVIKDLQSRVTPKNQHAMRLAIRSYRNRLDLVLNCQASPDTLRLLRVRTIAKQLAFVEERVRTGQTSRAVADRYENALEQLASTYESHRGFSGGRGRRAAHLLWVARSTTGSASEEERRELGQLHVAAERHAIDELRAMEPSLSDEERQAARIIAGEHRAHLASVWLEPTGQSGPQHSPSITARRTRRRDAEIHARDIEAAALSLELEQIRLLHDAGELSTHAARELREEVYLLQMGLEAR